MYHRIVRRRVLDTFAALGRGDYEPALAGMATRFDHVFSGTHALGGVRHSTPAMRRWFERLFRLNRTLSFAVSHAAVSGPPWNTTVVVEWHDSAVLADGGPYENDGVHVIRMRWGRVVSLHAYLDTQLLVGACARLSAAGLSEAGAAAVEG